MEREKKWQPWTFDECPSCGAQAEVLTSSTQAGTCYADDRARCSGCGHPGVMDVDETVETEDGLGRAYVQWHDHDCGCERCDKAGKESPND